MNTTAPTVTLEIEGMSCGHCVQAVTKSIEAVPGLRAQAVALGSARVALAGATAADAVDAVERAGFTARIADAPPAEPGRS